MASVSSPGSCPHKLSTGCILTAVQTCCACADRRPLASAYPTYVDGEGMKLEGARWQQYCWRCRDFYRESEIRESASMAVHSTPETWSFAQSLPPTSFSPFDGVQRRTGPFRATALPIRRRQPLREPTYELAATPTLPLEAPTDSSDFPSQRSRPALPHAHPETVLHDPSVRSEERRRRHNPTNAFGTREEWESPDYQSPVAGMFTRAWNRYRDAELDRRHAENAAQEELRRVSETTTPSQNIHLPSAPSHPPTRTNPFGPRETPHHSFSIYAPHTDPLIYNTHNAIHDELRRVQDLATTLVDSLATSSNTTISASHVHSHAHAHTYSRSRLRRFRHADHFDSANSHDRRRSSSPPLPNPIDTQPTRPPPLEAEDMTVNIGCRICSEQRADTLVLPCAHVAMCRWCVGIMRERGVEERRTRGATVTVSEMASGGGRLRGEGWRCPICRVAVEGTKRVYLA